ncbi:MAG: sigma-70 family RNA polymerase sigma factor [Anaerolineae bacterium]|nr:sigma-70 family RNA polymerase sigma factor [Anaerolineae bacterium]
MEDELKLLARARALEEDALAEIHQAYYRAIYRYIAFRVSDPPLAEDLTSEVFTRLLSALREKSAPQNTLRGWLYGVAARVVSDHFRQTGRAPQVELLETVAAETGMPEEEVDKRLTAERLRAAMQGLTEDQQRVLALRFGFGMRTREVAEAINKSEGAVKQLQLRALTLLSQQLSGGEMT